jgi:ferric-dicitrate binding protein FerR (iron transport regulator)
MQPVPTNEQLKELADKWMAGTLTAREKTLLESWYNAEEPAGLQWNGEETEEELEQKIFNRIAVKMREEESPMPLNPSKVQSLKWWLAAAAVVMLAVAGYFLYSSNTPKAEPVLAAVTSHTTRPTSNAIYTRYLVLPDSSIVVLHANSHLVCPQRFNGPTREVTLVGEAYFDIRHNPKKPFIIHAGDVKTTVLGTAFNISAYPGAKKIIVSVTRGKVKVENEKENKLLSVLTKDEQVSYSAETTQAAKKTVNAVSVVTDWTKQDMIFEETPFDQTLQLLSRRYGVDIKFKKDKLKNCRIKAFFNGTESLEKVLDVLCIISNARYTLSPDAKTVLLDGDGCGG